MLGDLCYIASMYSLQRFAFPIALSCALFACQAPVPSDEGTSVSPDPAHTSRNSLDWSGTYSGVLPAEGGQTLRTTITLKGDGTYSLSTGETDLAAVQEGAFTWQADGSRIVLQNLNGISPNYLVGENQLIQLDLNGERYAGDMAGKVILQRREEMGGMPLTETYWKLVELSGQTVAALEGRLPAHILIGNEDDRAAGNSGCNSFFCSYELDVNAGTISFQQAGSTMMACIDMRTEEEFLKNLPLVRKYSISGRSLTFSSAEDDMLMRFEAVDL